VDTGRAAQLAKYEEILDFLAAHDEHGKLRALADDIRDLRDRLLEEIEDEP
jgi:hypothetical protein